MPALAEVALGIEQSLAKLDQHRPDWAGIKEYTEFGQIQPELSTLGPLLADFGEMVILDQIGWLLAGICQSVAKCSPE